MDGGLAAKSANVAMRGWSSNLLRNYPVMGVGPTTSELAKPFWVLSTSFSPINDLEIELTHEHVVKYHLIISLNRQHHPRAFENVCALFIN